MYEIQIRFGSSWQAVSGIRHTRIESAAYSRARVMAQRYPHHAVRVVKIAE